MADTLVWNPETVAMSWLRSLGLSAATNLPDDSKWEQSTFCVVAVVPSRTPDRYDTVRTPSISVDVFGAPGAWGPVFSAAERIRDLTREFVSVTLTHPKMPDTVCDLRDVSPLTSATPVRFNQADKARVTFLLELTYFTG